MNYKQYQFIIPFLIIITILILIYLFYSPKYKKQESFISVQNEEPMKYIYIKVNGKDYLNLNQIKIFIRDYNTKKVMNIAESANFASNKNTIQFRSWNSNTNNPNKFQPLHFIDNNNNTTGHQLKNKKNDNLLIELKEEYPVYYLDHIYILNRQNCCKHRFPKILDSIQILDKNKNVLKTIKPTIPKYNNYNDFIFYNLNYYYCLNTNYNQKYTYTIDPKGKRKNNKKNIFVKYYFPINANIYKTLKNKTGDKVTVNKVSGAVKGGHDQYTFKINPSDAGNMNFYYYSSAQLKDYIFKFYFNDEKGNKINLRPSEETYISNKNMYRYLFKLNPEYNKCHDLDTRLFNNQDVNNTFTQGFFI